MLGAGSVIGRLTEPVLKAGIVAMVKVAGGK